MKTIINTTNAPAPLGPYNQAILHGNTLYISGQIAIDVKKNTLISENIEAETHQVMQNLKAILTASKMDFSNVLKSSIFLKKLKNFERINAIYASYFEGKTAPARETIEVSKLPKNAEIEISMIAGK